MSRWSSASSAKLAQLHPTLRAMCEHIRDYVDITIITGHRGQAEQDAAFAAGNSKLKWPHGKHNKLPSIAVDLQPYPVPTKESDLREELSYIAGMAIEWGRRVGVQIRWGGDWNSDWRTRDNSFDDLFHFELVGTG